MTIFVWNVLLAFVWAAAAGKMTMINLLIGFVLGYLVLSMVQRAFGPSNYFVKFWHIFHFFMFYTKELVIANLQVAYQVLSPRPKIRPGIIAIPLEAKTDLEIVSLANLITMTPGTLSLDVSSDRSVLYVHIMDFHDVESKRRIKLNLEHTILTMMR